MRSREILVVKMSLLLLSFGKMIIFMGYKSIFSLDPLRSSSQDQKIHSVTLFLDQFSRAISRISSVPTRTYFFNEIVTFRLVDTACPILTLMACVLRKKKARKTHNAEIQQKSSS